MKVTPPPDNTLNSGYSPVSSASFYLLTPEYFTTLILIMFDTLQFCDIENYLVDYFLF